MIAPLVTDQNMISHSNMPMLTMTDTVTAPTTALTQLLTGCLVDAAGTPWKDSAIRNRAASLVKLHTHASANGTITYEQLLRADVIDAFCDGRTAHSS